MADFIFITGGTRSGKSAFAEKNAATFGDNLGYLATAEMLDGEMSERVKLHRERRGTEWHTIEEPIQLANALLKNDGLYDAILVDCVTLWLSNLMFSHEDAGDELEELVNKEVQRLKSAMAGMKTPVILVSNEVGMGIVPENRLARLFRDVAGAVNQSLAAAASEAHVVISGIPLKLK